MKFILHTVAALAVTTCLVLTVVVLIGGSIDIPSAFILGTLVFLIVLILTAIGHIAKPKSRIEKQ